MLRLAAHPHRARKDQAFRELVADNSSIALNLRQVATRKVPAYPMWHSTIGMTRRHRQIFASVRLCRAFAPLAGYRSRRRRREHDEQQMLPINIPSTWQLERRCH